MSISTCVICARTEVLVEEIKDGVCNICRSAVARCYELERKMEEERGELVQQWMDDELADFRMVMDHCSQIYMHCSGGKISKPNTLPEEVIGEMEKIWGLHAWYVICVDQADSTFLGIEGPFVEKSDAEEFLASEVDRGATESELFYTGPEEPT